MKSLWVAVTCSIFALAAHAQTCSFTLSPISAEYNAAGGNGTVTITQVSGSGCARTAVSNATWITISYGDSGTGSGTAGYTVQANTLTFARTGTLTIAGQTFTVNQAAGTCTYSISPTSATMPAAGGSGSFNLTASAGTCPWTTASNAAWLTPALASGLGSMTLRYSALPNSATTARNATIAVAGQTFTLTQAGACSLTILPAASTVASGGGNGSVTVTASASSCAWTALSNTDWITITSGASATGSGTVGWSAAANLTGQDRTGSISIGNQGFSLLQSASNCAVTLSSAQQSFAAAGGSGSFLVTSACPWAASSTASWITVSYNSDTVNFSVAGNTDATTRTGFITVGNRSFSVVQAGVSCAVTISASSAPVPASGTSGSIHVSAGNGCSWTASTLASWITLQNATGAGEGDVSFTAAANTSASARTAIITIANQQFTVAQDGANCSAILTPAQATFSAAGGTGAIALQTSCAWTASAGAAWLTISSALSGTGNATLSYTVAPNPSSEARTASLRIGGQTATILQSGKDCSVVVTPTTVEIVGRGGTASVSVSGSTGCRWEPVPDANWISVPAWSAINGSGSVTIAASPNPDVAQRSGSVAIAGQIVAVIQRPAEAIVASVVNAASLAVAPIAPGEIVSIFGSGLGPAGGASYQLNGDRIATEVANVRVLFDGIPAPLLYVSPTQVNAIVPYGIFANPVRVTVANRGANSDPLALDTAAASPALFTATAAGRGQAAALNQDNSPNTAANAAARNSVVQLFATGEGATDPTGDDGLIANNALPKPKLAVSVTIGGQPATVTYAGAAPGQVAGLMQINARVPQTAAVGAAIPVIIRVGQAASPANVTIAVR